MGHRAEEFDRAGSGAEKIAETIEEVRFYLEHGMPEQAVAAFEKLQTLTSDEAILSALEAEIQAASQAAVEEASAVDLSSDFTLEEPAAEITGDEIPAAVAEEPEAEEPGQVEAALPVEPASPPVAEPPVAAPGVLEEFVSDLESSLGEDFLAPTVAHEAAPAVEHAAAASPTEPSQPELEPVGNAKPTTFGVPQTEVLGEFVADLEASLGNDFLEGAPVAQSAPAQPSPPEPEIQPAVAAVAAQQWPAPAPVRPIEVPAASAAAAAASSGAPSISSEASVAPARQSAAAPAAATPQISPILPGAPAAAKSSAFGEDAGVDLAEMFGELKQDLESGTATTEEDPETHYNLGIAFREMGLLDEAIGELQKTCQAVDRGHPFPQVMQTYTWLAQCFLDKGVPEAAIRWYQKALDDKGIDEETRTALHYEVAAAYEAAGDRPSALKHFMEVYGRNIDYRDVAERIKPLKS
jgi:tetratricopeptide (TPR) repeat protein